MTTDIEQYHNQSLILSISHVNFMDPVLQYELQLMFIESVFKMLMAVPRINKVKEVNHCSNYEENLLVLYQNIFNVFEDTLLVLVSKDLYKLQILKEIVIWMSKDSSYMQERIMEIISKVLSFASEKVKAHRSVDAPCLGELAAEMSLLCSHSDLAITEQASLGMYHLLCIAKCQNEDIFKNYQKLESSNTTSHPETEFLPMILKRDKSKIAQNVGESLMPSLLTNFVWHLLMKLSETNYKTVFEAATMLTMTLEYHADKVTMVSKIVDTIYKKLCGNCTYFMNHAMLRVITLLTRTSPKKVIFQLMDYPVPADNTLLMMWLAAGSEASVAPHVLNTLLLILKGKPGEMLDSSTGRRRLSLDATNMMPVAASQALCTLLPASSYRKAVAQFFPQLLMALMLQVCYSSDLRLTKSYRPFFARDALRTLLKCSDLQEVDNALQKKRCWSQFSHMLFYPHGVYLVAKTLGEYHFPQFVETLHYVYKLSVEDPRRSEDSITIAIFLIEVSFIRGLLRVFNAKLISENAVPADAPTAVWGCALLPTLTTTQELSNIENVCSLIFSILDAFLSKDKTVVIRALLTLRKLLAKLDKVIYSSVCRKIASRYSLLMEHSNGGIRSMAIWHFGELLKDMNQYTWMLNDVVLEVLVPLILFLGDTELRVVRACKYTLKIYTSQLNWSTSYWLNGSNYNFEMVVLSICNNLYVSHWRYITALISDTLGFLRSSHAYLRRGAVILTGYLAKLCGHLLFKDEIESMLDAIEQLLRDEDPVIKNLAKKTQKVIKETEHRLTSSSIKQTFQRLFNFFYFKKMKIIYHYSETRT
ncbi:maestro heat-like repeat-containing protein family member 9 [Orycteropus afer afer]|uniref:Maestro heat-like repeat-containing protein family member 9 n=1 Tax=Orycteropus afer afer TaxID=1230840 RepID=A0A8B6ZLJ7_ORYAF|nr:maestro heat-like repeat-containing protein family member 9 [Orycteropus afer afer]